MSRALIVIHDNADRERAASWCMKMPDGGRVEFQETKRTLPQNARLHAMLTDVATQVEWYGQKLGVEDWKDVFTASLRKARVVPGLDPGSFVLVGLHTSKMSKDEAGMLMELIAAFGAEHGVVFHDPKDPPYLDEQQPSENAL